MVGSSVRSLSIRRHVADQAFGGALRLWQIDLSLTIVAALATPVLLPYFGPMQVLEEVAMSLIAHALPFGSLNSFRHWPQADGLGSSRPRTGLSSSRGGARQRKSEGRATIGVVAGVEVAAEALDDRSADRQPHSHSSGPGRE